jgi:glycerophosphoryl diester phosphodiesterase
LAPSALEAPMTLSVHRFGKGEAPEGTLLAIENAVAVSPNVILEFDARLTEDGHVVVLHDETFDRTTGSPGRPEEMTLAEIRELDAGYAFTPDGPTRPYAGQGIVTPTLPEVLAAAPEARFLMDLKEPGALVEQAVEDVREAGAMDRMIFASFHGPALEQVRELAPEAVTSFDMTTGFALGAALQGGDWESYEPPAQVLAAGTADLERLGIGEEEIAMLQGKGIRVIVFVLDRPDQVREWIGNGVDGIMTSYPSMAARVLEDLGVSY